MEIRYIHDLPLDRWEEFRDLRLEALRADPLAFSSGSDLLEYSEKDWKDRLQKALDGNSILVFAESDGKLVGMGSVYLYEIDRYKHNASLQGLFVSVSYRGKGIGVGLINERIKLILPDSRIIQVMCEIFSSQVASLELHKKLGFEVTGKMSDFVKDGDNFYDSVFLQKQIR